MFLSIVIHLLIRLLSSIASLEARGEVDAERYQNVGFRLQQLERRFDKGVLT
jgi:hypothetical protein